MLRVERNFTLTVRRHDRVCSLYTLRGFSLAHKHRWQKPEYCDRELSHQSRTVSQSTPSLSPPQPAHRRTSAMTLIQFDRNIRIVQAADVPYVIRMATNAILLEDN